MTSLHLAPNALCEREDHSASPPIYIRHHPRSLRLTIDTSLATSARSCSVVQERAPSKLGQRVGASE
jgi:hypothetical protein